MKSLGIVVTWLPGFVQACVYYKKRIGMNLVYVGFEVLTAVSVKMAVFWVVAPCSLVEVYQRFRGPCCLHHQGDHRPDYTALQPRRQPSSTWFIFSTITNCLLLKSINLLVFTGE
jgi:hypothetical protein